MCVGVDTSHRVRHSEVEVSHELFEGTNQPPDQEGQRFNGSVDLLQYWLTSAIVL